MTDEERKATLAFIEKYTAANTVSKEAARATMIKEGIYTPDGKLRVEFGGETEKPRKGKGAA